MKGRDHLLLYMNCVN